MREHIIKLFARIFAVLGCSTLVAACYGVPYELYNAGVSGRVTDDQTGEPIKGIKVRITVGDRAQTTDNPVQSISPMVSPVDVYTDSDGRFNDDIDVGGIPDGVLIECFDVDGESNGLYMPESKVYSLEEAADADIRLDRN